MKVRPKNGRAVLTYTTPEGSAMTIEHPLEELEIPVGDYQFFKPFCHQDGGWHLLRKERLRIWVPDGIGDLHWVFMKLEGLKKLAGASEVTLCKQDVGKLDLLGRKDRADDFVLMNPTVTRMAKSSDLISLSEAGCVTEALGYDYILNPCPVFERGGRIEDWLPLVPTNYNYDMNWPVPAEMEPKRPVVYFGDRYAEVTWGGKWTDAYWAQLINSLTEMYGRLPVVVGLANDKEKALGVKARGCDFIDMVGQTSLTEVLSLIFASPIFVASVSGLSIISASRGVKTVALWPDNKSLSQLPVSQRTCWLRETINYRALGYSTPVSLVIGEVEELKEGS